MPDRPLSKWSYRVVGAPEWVTLDPRAIALVLEADVAEEAGREHWRRNLPGFETVELELRSPRGDESRWVVDVEHRPAFLATRRQMRR